jgi:hypothetical protein
MRNFQQLAGNINITPLLHQVMLHPELWNQHTLRTAHPLSPHQQVDDILLRFQEMPEAGKEHEVIDAHESIWYPAWNVLTEAHALVFDLARMVKAERIGRILISRMAPGKEIAPHIDGGDHARYYTRYHIVLESYPGCLFKCEEEQVQMRGGDVWYFDNAKTHSVVNHSANDRLTMVVDLRTA